MTSKELADKLNAMDLHIHKDEKGFFWNIPNKANTVVQIVEEAVFDYSTGLALRITDKYSGLYEVEHGLDEIRTRIQFMYNTYDKRTN